MNRTRTYARVRLSSNVRMGSAAAAGATIDIMTAESKRTYGIRRTSEYKELPVRDALELLESPANGLAESEVQRRLQASMGLTEAGVRVIIDAIKTSRHIYQRMLTWVINKVTKVIQVIGLLTVAFFWFHDTVVSLPGMALLIFANDFVTISLATAKRGVFCER